MRGLEQQYDAVAGAETRGNLVAEPAELPSADELGADFERFLAEREGDGGEGRRLGAAGARGLRAGARSV